MGDFRDVYEWRAQQDSSGGGFLDSPAEGFLSCLWSVLNVALCGASFLMAHGPLLSFLVCVSFPCGQGVLDTSWGKVNPLSLGIVAVPV